MSIEIIVDNDKMPVAIANRDSNHYSQLIDNGSENIFPELYECHRAEIEYKKRQIKPFRANDKTLKQLYYEFGSVNTLSLDENIMASFLIELGYNKIKVKGGYIDLRTAITKYPRNIRNFFKKELDKLTTYIELVNQ